MKKNKVLFLLGDIWSLGKGRGMPSIFKVLEKADSRFDVTIFTTDKNNYKKELPNSKIYYFNDMSLNILNNKYFIYIINRIRNIILNLKYIYYYIKLQQKFDVIYCSSSIPIYTTFVVKYFTTVKTIHRIYGTFLYPKLNSKLDKIKKFEEVLSFKIEADKYIITDDGTYGNKVASYYNIPNNKIVFLRNGVEKINVDKDNIITKYNIDNNFKCLCVSRLTGWKRVDRVIKAFNKIKEDDIVLYIVGDGEEYANLKKLSQNKNIIFLGALESNDVHGLMNCVDCFISMYDISNIGNPLLEALSYNLPIITYNSGNTKDIIDGNNGILIDVKDEDKIVEMLYNSIIELYNKPQLLEKLSNNAKKFADNNLFSWDKRIEIELKVIEDLCHEN